MNALDPPDDQVQALTVALRRLLGSGEQFRHSRAQQLQLGRNDLTVLAHLYDSGPLTPRDIAALLGMTSGTITPLLDRVEEAGFLNRNKNPADRRSLLITITPAGQHALDWIHDQLDVAMREVLAEISEPDAETLAMVLDLFSRALDARVQAAPGVEPVSPPPPRTGPHAL
ncbi:MarR family winged helix-turn-helix transcriptional regulator [Glaciibacter superstes]|uniref:MarR family winged helix-turn-helix transcriptional regulator n=1 Tax=Glaciibacter superstes TaxID=501023 RepID=UPI0003B7586F|nr:MarR family transcriptional regulator [Glaciibacter superstes]